MPNWIEGTMKLRGKREDIKRFFDEGVEASGWFGETREREEQIINNSDEDCLDYSFNGHPHIKETRRMFITDNYLYFEKDEGVCCFNIKQAWSFTSLDRDEDALIQIADKYNLDIKLYGIECGIGFCQEVFIRHGRDGKAGEIVYNNVVQYEDWDWECPFPYMGG